MANTTNSVDLYDNAFATTHADLLTEKQDETGKETTPAQQQTACGEHWGNFTDDHVLALRDQGFVPVRYTDATTNATPSAQDVYDVPDGGMVEVRTIAVGQVGANDHVYRTVSRTYERDGGTVQQIASDVGTAQYSSGGTLTTATADIVLSGSMTRVQVTGEAATAITWRLYTTFLEIFA